jgi:hypothetical protein
MVVYKRASLPEGLGQCAESTPPERGWFAGSRAPRASAIELDVSVESPFHAGYSTPKGSGPRLRWRSLRRHSGSSWRSLLISYPSLNLHPKASILEESDIGTEGKIETQGSMRKIIFYATILSGRVADYLMYRRGESFGAIAKQAITNPVGSLVSEVKNAV